jgi:NADPH-dependent glutamate synthase beta subunit-like oxidoreductase/NAD(P)H-flavin reductase
MGLGKSLSRYGFDFSDLFTVAGLRRLDEAFLRYLREGKTPELAERLRGYRDGAGERLGEIEISELLMAVAAQLELFLAGLFGNGSEVEALRATTSLHDPVLFFKEEFVMRRARRYRKSVSGSFDELDAWLNETLHRVGYELVDRELDVARYGMSLLADPQANHDALERLTRWCAMCLRDPLGHKRVFGWASFHLPAATHFARLVPAQQVPGDPLARLEGPSPRRRRRDGFALTDPRMKARDVQAQADYCVYCHTHEGDFCARGFPERKGHPELGLKVNPLGEILTGCPLEEKISEMHSLKRDGLSIAPLAVAMVNNPMIPATGHRICNDCMKACIYQKQDPVDIPQIETRVLTDVLSLPWGVEIYDLLTRWNPLRRDQFLPKPFNGRKVLIVGQGPAGFTMAHHLTMEGCAVVGIDGLKIEPLPGELLHGPIRDYAALVEPLEKRVNAGFGGVAEYGITVRWDKNFLRLVQLSLCRRPTFQVFGGVRFGGTLTLEDAWELGFEHVCIATGTGLPRVLPIGNSLARGMRQATDFLMALQLTGAAKESSLATLQVRLPAVVIGGGLTAIDTATEVQSYYIVQVEKTLARYEKLVEARGEAAVRHGLNEEDEEILNELLLHAREVRAVRARAAAAGEDPDFVPLLRAWGGVSIAYRKGMNSSPAYLRNHGEIIKALEEGIYYAEGLDPLHVQLDRFEHVQGVTFRVMASQEGRWLASGREVTLPARAVFVAAGALPNTIYEQEHPGTFKLDGTHFLPCVSHDRGCQQPVSPAGHCKAPDFGPFTSYERGGRRVSFIGDTHPVFHGSVVKAIASAKRSYPHLMKALGILPRGSVEEAAYEAFRRRIEDLLTATVSEVRCDNPALVELWVRAPLAARNFRPGHFYRLQTFERRSPMVAGTRLQIPQLTVSGAGVEGERIRLMLFQGAAIPRLAKRLRPGEPLVLMGPNGEATDLGSNRAVLVVAGQWGAAVMLGLGPALREAGNRVLYVAAYRSAAEIDYRKELEAAADQVVWCVASAPPVEGLRAHDCSVVGANVIDVLRRYGAGEIAGAAGPVVRLGEVEAVFVVGSTGLLRALRHGLHDELRGYLRPDVEALGTVGSPMQCMLKGVCAQCLQWQVDPETGVRTRTVFSCAMQDQPLAWVDLDNLAARIAQNRLPDRLTTQWLEYVESGLARPGN